MSGMIVMSDDIDWSASAWLYELVVKCVMRNVGSAHLRDRLRETVDGGFGVVNLREFSAEERQQVLAYLRTDLLGDVRSELPKDLDNREARLSHLQELVDASRRVAPEMGECR